jgi:hypothetical protein
MMSRVVRSLAILSVLARGAGAQADSLVLGDREANAELAKIVAAARDAGLPVDPIFGKVRYGLVVVHAPPQRIVSAARALAARLQTARDALAPQATGSDIATGADALEYGATKDELRAVRAASGDQSFSTSLGVLAQLVASGVPAKRAAAIVTDLIKRRVTAAQLVALGTDVNSDVAKGAQANAALDTRLRGLTAVLAPSGAAATTGPGLTSASGPTGPKKP